MGLRVFYEFASKPIRNVIMKMMKQFLVPALFGIALSAPMASAQITLNPISTSQNGVPADLYDESAAEIVKFDPVTQRMYVVNGFADAIDIFDVSDPSDPVLFRSVDLSAYGNPNSVDVHPVAKLDQVAVAVGSGDATVRGSVVFLNKNGDFLRQLQVGYLPDMLTYGPKGRYLVVANEGEPNDDYSFDPVGSVSIIRTGRSNVEKYSTTEVDFRELTMEDIPGFRITGPEGTTIAQDLEPEYVAICGKGKTAFVACQENNGILVVDIKSARVLRGFGLGFIDRAQLGNAMDASDRDDMIRIANWRVKGLPMPDAIACYEARSESVKGKNTYIVTANEGDGRDYVGYSDESRLEDLDLDPSSFPMGDTMKLRENCGRLDIITTEGNYDEDAEYEELFHFGGRSFSIYTEAGERIYDSGEFIETWLANNAPEGAFNATNDENNSEDSRSDAKGPEPEAIEIGVIGETTYVFVGLERVGGVMVFNITDPHNVSFVTYFNNRDFTVDFDADNLANLADAGDLGPEGIDFVSAEDSPNGVPLLIVANEVSGTTTIYELNPAEF